MRVCVFVYMYRCMSVQVHEHWLFTFNEVQGFIQDFFVRRGNNMCAERDVPPPQQSREAKAHIKP